MATAYVRVADAWVQSNLTGKARYEGGDVAFAPPGATTESIAWAGAPSDTDENDGTQAYIMGVEFTVTTGVPCYGVVWRVPDSVVAPAGGPHAISLWNVSESRTDYKEFTPVPGGDQEILFDTATNLGSASSWSIAVYTNHYVFTLEDAAGYDTPSGNVAVAAGRLAAYNGGAASAPYPGTITTALNFHISPLVGIP